MGHRRPASTPARCHRQHSLEALEIAGDPARVCEWLGQPVEQPLEDVKVDWVAPNGTPGIVAAHFQTRTASSASEQPPGISPTGRSPARTSGTPQVYEIENRAVDPAGAPRPDARPRRPWEGRDVLDVGCGTGFHLPVFAATAASVTGVEPHPDLPRSPAGVPAGCRTSRCSGVGADLPLAAGSVDVVHARWAYFFGPGCEPGLAELDRVVRRGGRAFVVDNDPTRSTFGSWFRRGYPGGDHAAVVAFWAAQGWEPHRVDMAWTFDAREDLEAVVRIEFAGDRGRRCSPSTPAPRWTTPSTCGAEF